jgi:hypothetical protein
VPGDIAAPGETVVATMHAEGAQVYECKTDAGGRLAWQFREPIATLLVDQRINTVGGAADGACDRPGAFLSAAYATDYVFLRK